MIKKVYYLNTCSTCKSIIKELNLEEDFELQNVKENPISEIQLESLRQFSGTYESLLNKRSVLFRERNLKEQSLLEQDYKALILEHYSLLKRPIIQIEGHYFIGNSKKTVEDAKNYINSL